MSDVNNATASRTTKRGISRRRLLQGGAAVGGLAAGSGALTGFPTIWAQNIKDVVLHHAGPPVSAIPKIGEQATKDLGFTIQMQAVENADLLNRFLSQSDAIDVGDVSIVFMKYLVGRNVLQGIPIAKFKDWDKIIPLFTKGVYPSGSEASMEGRRAFYGAVCRQRRWAEIQQRTERLGHRHPDHHQCRYTRHSPRQDRPPDRQLGRSAEPRL